MRCVNKRAAGYRRQFVHLKYADSFITRDIYTCSQGYVPGRTYAAQPF